MPDRRGCESRRVHPDYRWRPAGDCPLGPIGNPALGVVARSLPVASVPDGDRVVMRSSHCPSGCEFDRHSEADSRFVRVREDGEGVIFSTGGAGAVTRIWMVMGEGVSEPLDARRFAFGFASTAIDGR